MTGRPLVLLHADRFRVERIKQIAPDGSEQSRDIVRHPGAVTIVPLIDDDHVCLIHNYRVSVQQTLLELPAGTREVDEDPFVTAQRELTEETGYVARQWDALHPFYMSPGILDEKMYLFVARDLRYERPRREPGEWIENRITTWAAALEMVYSGAIQDAKTIVSLLLADQWRKGQTKTARR